MFQSVNEFPFWISDTLTHITLAPKIEKKINFYGQRTYYIQLAK